MHYQRHILLLIILVSILISGCQKPVSNQNTLPGGDLSALDSIKTLDSLVSLEKIRNPGLAKKYACNALSVAKLTNNPSMIVYAYRLLGISMLNTYHDSSLIYYQRGLKLADSLRLREQLPHLYYNLASIYQENYDFKTALVYYDSARGMFSAMNDPANLSNAWCAIGIIRHELKDRAGAKTAYDSAISIAEVNSKDKQLGIALANYSRYQESQQKAISMQLKAIEHLSKTSGTEEEIAGILMNLGYNYLDPDSAKYYFQKALFIGEKFGLRSVTLAAYNGLAYAFLDLGNIRKAEQCLRDFAIPIAKADSNIDWLSTLYDSYADILTQKGMYKEALTYARMSKELKAQFDLERADNQTRMLSVLLDLKNKELLIEKQSIEIIKKANRNKQTVVLFIIALLIAVGLGVILVILSQRHRLKFQSQRIESAKIILRLEEQNKEQLGRELHDLTGQIMLGLNQEMGKLTFHEPLIKQQVQQRIQEFGKSLRGLSHKMARPGIGSLSLAELIADLCINYRTTLSMDIEVTLPENMPRLQNGMSLQIFRIVQELLNNAAKYARESLVTLTLKYDNKNLEIAYIDEGPGFDMNGVKEQGIGISTIFERTKFIGGKAVLDSNPGAGTFWEIQIPVEKDQLQQL